MFDIIYLYKQYIKRINMFNKEFVMFEKYMFINMK